MTEYPWRELMNSMKSEKEVVNRRFKIAQGLVWFAMTIAMLCMTALIVYSMIAGAN